MKSFFRVVPVVFIAGLVTACGGLPVVHRPGATASVGALAGTERGDCILPYGIPDRYEGNGIPVSVVPLYGCRQLQPVIEWAKRASRHESDRGGCEVNHTSFRCWSRAGPQGWSRDKKEGGIAGEDMLSLYGAVARLSDCVGYPSIYRELAVSAWRDHTGVARWRWEARYECYR